MYVSVWCMMYCTQCLLCCVEWKGLNESECDLRRQIRDDVAADIATVYPCKYCDPHTSCGASLYVRMYDVCVQHTHLLM